MELIFASQNRHKAQEIETMLPGNIKLLTLADVNFNEKIIEFGTTFQENALIKAKTIYDKYKMPVFADDSGLEVEFLGGRPGVFSSRYAGEEGNDFANIQKLLAELHDVENRKAQFRCCIALIWNNQEYFFNGIVRGTIAQSPRGTNGFGYDPIFIPEGYQQTFAELSPCVKNAISHRTLAVKQMVEFISRQKV
jgi:XTP/dITP diphosphohydrolase